jgi:hypothetical protein
MIQNEEQYQTALKQAKEFEQALVWFLEQPPERIDSLLRREQIDALQDALEDLYTQMHAYSAVEESNT